MGNAGGMMKTMRLDVEQMSARREIMKLWQVMVTRDGARALGARIYLEVLNMSPSLPHLFHMDKVSPSDYPKHPVFNSHSQRIFDALDRYFTLWAQGRDRKLNREARALGRQHYRNLQRKHKTLGTGTFNPALWLTMHQILQDLFQEQAEERHRVRKELSQFVDAVIAPMRNGYLHAQSGSNRSNSGSLIPIVVKQAK